MSYAARAPPSPCTASRLINIGHAEDFSDMRLEVRPDRGWNNVPYTVVSHYWGTPPFMPLQLTADNLNIMTTRIEFDKLHLTFQDAITATRLLLTELNVQHVWIDSLCISQTHDDGSAGHTIRLVRGPISAIEVLK
ncbi:HET-domain-containing protein [Hyaloscypha variabilis F]|uniref:HET-domain-containing protein n=1 Tax=Hyaloscypha variabilis (strain UAMH 11265 / GT02V1 / F) TaxID=1149755 RepID=A0A2J6R5I3_HYAVF|nr:HET-domain-containing protein [Hyaloscypha variabilis F]